MAGAEGPQPTTPQWSSQVVEPKTLGPTMVTPAKKKAHPC
jgi:hypothetical protein